MFLAQSLVFFGEERLTLQISGADLWREPKMYRPGLLFTQHSQHFLVVVAVSETVSWTYRTHKAGVVPGESQSLQELVPCLDGEVTAVAVGPKQVVVV